MAYCRYCGTEITYSRTQNEKWMPMDVTGTPHFCRQTDKPEKSGLKVCQKCGKPVFLMKSKKIDYGTLSEHICKKADITRFKKYNIVHNTSITKGSKK